MAEQITTTATVDRITNPEDLMPHIRTALMEKVEWHGAQERVARFLGKADEEKFHHRQRERLDLQIRNRVGELAERNIPSMMDIAETRCAFNRETVRREEAAAEKARRDAAAAERVRDVRAEWEGNGRHAFTGHRKNPRQVERSLEDAARRSRMGGKKKAA